MIKALTKALSQLGDPRLLRIVGLSAIAALATFILLWSGTGWLLSIVDWAHLPLVGGAIQWLGSAFDYVGAATFVVIALIVSFILFPALMTVILSLFLDKVCEAVEVKHYPDLGPARDQSVAEGIVSSLRFLVVVIGVNILALPFYALLMFLPPLNLILYYLVNGYLIGREFYELVAFRRLPPAEAQRLRLAFRGRVMMAGAVIAFAMTMPVVNLFAPVIAAAMMVHLFQGMSRRAAGMAR